ncbi:MAG TPA: hypothetical protein ENN94_01515 [Geoalkalibacter subterraneus]|uniref:Uncharacterized protein n=1 Tax=Geoalkalibacter subterraneus TaxID=483547 RepID=A0A831LSM2_9BACT|nr:hypothetical protein [Geoalkalibacter subterraneus]
MIALDLEQAASSALYLDIHHVEFTDEGALRVCALLGDGWYEGEVMIEAGDQVNVTLADLYLDEAAIRPLLQRIGRDALERAVGGAVSRMKFAVDGGMRGRRPSAPRIVAYHLGGRTHTLSRISVGVGPRKTRIPRRGCSRKVV